MNWEAGLVLASRADGRGHQIAGLSSLGFALATRANLATLPATDVSKELAELTWDYPAG